MCAPPGVQSALLSLGGPTHRFIQYQTVRNVEEARRQEQNSQRRGCRLPGNYRDNVSRLMGSSVRSCWSKGQACSPTFGGTLSQKDRTDRPSENDGIRQLLLSSVSTCAHRWMEVAPSITCNLLGDDMGLQSGSVVYYTTEYLVCSLQCKVPGHIEVQCPQSMHVSLSSTTEPA